MDEIKRYLDEHGATYTPDALRRGLLDAGYDPAEVDTALRDWEAERAGNRPNQEDRQTFGRWAFRLHLGALLAVIGLVVLLKGTTNTGLAFIAALVLVVPLLLGWVISSVIGRALLPRGVVLALVVPAISALALGGTCLALMNAAIPTPPRDGSVRLQIDSPMTFVGSGPAACYVGSGSTGVQVTSQELGTLDGMTVGAYLSWYGNDSNVPAPKPSVSLSIMLATESHMEIPPSYSTIFSTHLEVDAAADSLSGTIQFEGLAAEPMGGPTGEPVREPISGSVSWACDQ